MLTRRLKFGVALTAFGLLLLSISITTWISPTTSSSLKVATTAIITVALFVNGAWLISSKRKTAWVIMVMGIITLVMIWYGYPQVIKWEKDRKAVSAAKPSSANAITPATPATREVSSRGGSKTITARTEEPLEFVHVPASYRYNVYVDGCVEITATTVDENGLSHGHGKYKVCPNSGAGDGVKIKGHPITHSIKLFPRSLIGSEVGVIFEW